MDRTTLIFIICAIVFIAGAWIIIDNIVDNTLIIVEEPYPMQEISSPVTIKGEAVGYWYFEGDFPVTIVTDEGEVLAQWYVTAQDEWMTESFVPFEGSIAFSNPANGESVPGKIIFHRDNPTGLPENDNSIEVPVIINSISEVACTLDAKLCPDGSYVSRIPPDCEFAPCPGE